MTHLQQIPRWYRAALSILVFCALFSLPIRGWAGGGPAGYIVVYNPQDLNSLTIANSYEQIRGIPERNMVPYVFPGTFTRSSAWDFVYSLRQTLAAKGIATQLQGIALAGLFPLDSAQSVVPGNLFSFPAFLYLSPNYSQASFPTQSGQNNNAYPNLVDFDGPAPAGTQAMAASTVFYGQTYWPCSFVGFPGIRGNGLTENLAYLNHAKAADGSKPNGTIYWPLNSDIRSSARQPEIEDVAQVWNARGIKYSISGNSTTAGNYWVANQPDVVGGLVSSALFDTKAGNTFLPGSWGDHLTSYGGILDTFTSQTPCSMWIRAGAYGSSGAMSEPYVIAAKFPHAHIHTHLHDGASIAEAFWQSLQEPAEVLCLGDSLLQPYADFPVVNVTAPADGATVNGIMPILATASPTGSKTLEPNLELFIDGRRIAIGSSTETVNAPRTTSGFNLYTATLADGWHEVRVVAYNADSVRTQGEKKFGIIVNNANQSLTVSGSVSVSTNGTNSFTVTPSGLGDLTSLTLQANGLTLGSLPVAGGTLMVSGTLVPLNGNWTVYAVGTRANGQTIWSAPFTAAITCPAAPATVNPPLGSSAADVRVYYASTTYNTNNWSATPDFIGVLPGDPTKGVYLTGSSVPGLTVPNWNNYPGFELNFYFYAPIDDWYEVGVYFSNYRILNGIALDGQDLTPTLRYPSGNNCAFAPPERLAQGWHTLRVRTIGNINATSCEVLVRGGASQDFVPFSLANVANTATGAAPSIVGITPSQSPVSSGSSVLLTGSATISDGSALKYYWTLLNGGQAMTTGTYSSTLNGDASPVTFSANGTTSGSTTVTFVYPGNYVFGLRVSGTAGSAVTSSSLSAVQTITSNMVAGVNGITSTSNATMLLSQQITNVYAYSMDQFGRRITVTGTNGSNPTVRWSSTDPHGVFTLSSTNGESAQYSSVSGSGTFTITATGTNGRPGSATAKVTMNPSNSISIAQGTTDLFIMSQSVTGHPVQFTANVPNANDPGSDQVTYQWTVVSAPLGQTLTLAGNNSEINSGLASGPGTYTVELVVTGMTGTTLTETRSFTIDSLGNYAPVPEADAISPQNPALQVGDTVFFSDPAMNLQYMDYQWQVSVNSGTTWLNSGTINQATFVYGPVAATDNGTMVRILASSLASGSSAGSIPSKLNVSNPSGGGIGIANYIDSTDSITADVNSNNALITADNIGTINFLVRRSGLSNGAVSVTYNISPPANSVWANGGDYSPATLGTDYTASLVSGTLQWAAGDTTDRTVPVTVINKPSLSLAALQLQLGNPTGGATLSSVDSLAYVCINHDPACQVIFSNNNVTVNKTNGSVTLWVNRAGSTAGSASVNYQTDIPDTLYYANLPSYNETAVAGKNYTATSGTLTWANGDSSSKQITIPILNDGLVDGNLLFTVGLSSQYTAYTSSLSLDDVCFVTIKEVPYQQWLMNWWPASIPVQPANSTTSGGILGLAPLFFYRFSETSGSMAAAVGPTGSVAFTGTLSVTGTGSYALGQAGPRPPTWPGLENANTALTLTASGSTGTPAQYSGGAALNSGTANGLNSYLGNGFTVSAFVKTNVQNRVMTLLSGSAGSHTLFQVTLNQNATAPTAVTTDNLRIFLQADASAAHTFNYSVPFNGLPTGSLTDGQWHHIAITVSTVSDTTLYPHFYFDGAEGNALNVRGLTTLSSTDSFASFTSGLFIGGSKTGGYFSGTVDEFAVFPTMLSSTNIACIASAGSVPQLPGFMSGTASFAGDGVPNLMKYSLGLNPLLPVGPGSLPSARIVNNHLTLNFYRISYATDVTYHVQASNDLINWTQIYTSGTDSYSGGSAPSMQLSVPDIFQVTDPTVTRRFLRLEITSP